MINVVYTYNKWESGYSITREISWETGEYVRWNHLFDVDFKYSLTLIHETHQESKEIKDKALAVADTYADVELKNSISRADFTKFSNNYNSYKGGLR